MKVNTKFVKFPSWCRLPKWCAVSYQSSIKIVGFWSLLKHPVCLATLKSCDTMKQSVDDNIYMYIYIYIYIYIYVYIYL